MFICLQWMVLISLSRTGEDSARELYVCQSSALHKEPQGADWEQAWRTGRNCDGQCQSPGNSWCLKIINGYVEQSARGDDEAFDEKLFMSLCLYQTGWSRSNDLDLYLADTRFESQPRYWLPRWSSFCGFPQSLQAVPWLGQDHFLSKSSPVHYHSSVILTTYAVLSQFFPCNHCYYCIIVYLF